MAVQRVEKTDAEWKALLDPELYRVARGGGTERAFTGCHWDNHAPGVYRCRCCGTDLFEAGRKFESGSGWPSFTTPVSDDAIVQRRDLSHGMVRTEVLCAACDAHLGHVFEDGPREAGGLRFCINSVVLEHIPAQ